MSVVKKTRFIVVIALLWLTACSSYYASNAETNYLKSHNGPDLVVPSPLTKTNMGYFYNLPPQNQNAVVSVVPPTV